MKKVICLVIMLGIAASPVFSETLNIDKAELKLVVRGANRLEIQRVFFDRAGNEVVVERNDTGLPRVLTGLALLNERKANLQDQVWIDGQISEIDTQIADLEVQKQMLIDSVNIR